MKLNIDELVAAIAVACLLIACLAGCGGGSLTTEEIAQHDADVQALHSMTIQPVNCTTGACK